MAKLDPAIRKRIVSSARVDVRVNSLLRLAVSTRNAIIDARNGQPLVTESAAHSGDIAADASVTSSEAPSAQAAATDSAGSSTNLRSQSQHPCQNCPEQPRRISRMWWKQWCDWRTDLPRRGR
jgi:hypothetical protein